MKSLFTMPELWPHQQRGVQGVIDGFEMGEDRICLTSPTGGGKSLIAASIMEWGLTRGYQSVFYTNRRLLIEQMSKAMQAYGFTFGVRAAGHDDLYQPNEPIQIASTQSEHVRAHRRDTWKPHHAQIEIWDELHLQKGKMAAEIMDYHATHHNSRRVGLTATPLGVHEDFPYLVQAGSVSECRKVGALLPCHTFGPTEFDTRHIERVGADGEFNLKDVRRKWTTKIFGHVFEHWKILNPEQLPTILFAPGVDESVWFAEQFEGAGVAAAHIDGADLYMDRTRRKSSPADRKELIDRLRTGDIKVLTNRFVAREGVDIPELYHCILATPIGSLVSYLQTVGRVLRAHPSMDHVILQDHGGCLDEDSEVLTKRGWVGIDEIADDDTIGTMNVDTSKFEWCDNEGTLRKQRDAEMIATRASCPHLDFRVTGYHEMVMTPDNRRCKWRKQLASDLAQRNSVCQVPVSLVEDVPPCELTDSEITFIGWYFTDGGKDADRVRIYQSETAPKEHHDNIVWCLQGCGFRYSVKTRTRPSPWGGESREVSYSVSSGKKSEGGYKRLAEWLDKTFPLEIFERLNRRQFGVLLHAMNLGDGCKHAGYDQQTITLAVASRVASDNIQSLAVRRGYRCNIAVQEQTGDKIRKASRIHLLHIRDTQHAHIMPGTLVSSYIAVNERVWCVQTKNGTLICRRNGRVCVMGNSWWRHGSPNLDRDWSECFELAPRVITDLRLDNMRDRVADPDTGQPVEPEPIVCPMCGKVRAFGIECRKEQGGCGYVSRLKTRKVLQADGMLHNLTGDIFKPRKRKVKDDTEKIWRQCYHRCRNAGRTFKQAEGLFFVENHYWPPHNLPLMPINRIDWFRKVHKVPEGMLQ